MDDDCWDVDDDRCDASSIYIDFDFDFFPVYTKHITLQSFSFCFRHLFSPLFQAGGLPRRAVTTFGPSWFSATGSFTVLRSNPISEVNAGAVSLSFVADEVKSILRLTE